MPKKRSELQKYNEGELTPHTEMTAEEQERVDFIRQRFTYMAMSRSVTENKWLLIKQLYQVYERHLSQGEVWNTPYRFAELFGAVQRKFSDLVDNLPEAKVTATRAAAQDFAITQQATLDHTDKSTNAIREKSRVILDSVMYGTGILFEGYARNTRRITPVDGDELQLDRKNTLEAVIYDGLVSERVDPRDFFIDETAVVFSDETGITGARDCVRRRTYPASTFFRTFKDFKHIDLVQPVSWGTDVLGWGKIPFEKESQEQKTVVKYVIVLEYWNVELDMMVLNANGIEIYCGAIPFKHKRLPFVVYYNYRRDDSVWGISEAEVLAPYIYAKEELTNLMILDDKLALQPAIAVSGDVMFNSEEAELQPGAIFTLRGLNGGKVEDAIAPLRFGGIPQEAFTLLDKIEDAQIIATGDDIRALYSNPDQLATQTLSKREMNQKRLRSNVLQNTTESERCRVQLRISNIVQFYAKPYQTIDGRVEFRRIPVEGYEIIQQDDEQKPEFRQVYGAQGYFTLNQDAIGDTSYIDIEIVDRKLADDLKKEELDKMLGYLQQVTAMIPIMPQLAQELDIKSLLRQIARKMDFDYQELFPVNITGSGEDTIDLELQLILLGQVPPIDPNQDPMRSIERYLAFMDTDIYRESKAVAKQALAQLIQQTSAYVPEYLQQQLAKRRKSQSGFDPAAQQTNMGETGAVPQPGIGGSVPELPGGTVSPGSQPNPQPTPTVSAPRGVAEKFGFVRA